MLHFYQNIHSQIPRKFFATSKWPVGTAPISPSPGTSWMATTALATLVTSASTAGRDHTLALVLTLATYITQAAVWLRLDLPFSTPQLWPDFLVTGISLCCGCMCTGLPSTLLLLTLIKFMLKWVSEQSTRQTIIHIKHNCTCFSPSFTKSFFDDTVYFIPFRSTDLHWSEHKALAISNMPWIHCEYTQHYRQTTFNQ